jgi:hypothetical protein
MATVLLPNTAYALEQVINAELATGTSNWTFFEINDGSYFDIGYEYDGSVGDPPGSTHAWIQCKNGFKSDGTMLAECYQALNGGNTLASAAYVDILISDYYMVDLFANGQNWSISANGGLYKGSDGTLFGTRFRSASYSGSNDQPATGPFRLATWTALLPAGESFTFKLNWGLFVSPIDATGQPKYNYVHHWFDKIYCNFSPSGLQVTENVTGTASLTWNPSSTLAGGNYARDYYNIYSSTSSGGPWTFVDSTNSASYEHNPVDNDIYYCITDLDFNGTESPKSVACLYRRTRIEITQVSSPKTSVTQGQGGVPVAVTLMNPGPSDISFGGASLTFKIPAIGQYNWSLVSPAIGATIPGNGGTLSLSFSVDVLASSTPDTDWIDATATGTNSITGIDVYDTHSIATHTWLIRSPAKLKVLSVTTPTTVYLGQTDVPVDILVENEGDDNAAALWDSSELKFSWGSYLNIVPQTTLPIAVYAGQASSVRYLLEVDPGSATGTATIDAWIKFRDANLLIPSSNNDGAAFKGQWTIVAGFVNTFKDASRDISQTSFNVGSYTVYARAENLAPLKEHRMRWYDPDDIEVTFSDPAITTDNTGLFDDEIISLAKAGTWRVTCTRVFDSITLAENYFEVGNPASLTLSVALPDNVSLGQTFIATVTVNNIGSATAVDVELATMTLVTGGASWVSGPTPVRQDISGASSKSYQLQWQATALGDLSLQCAAFGFDDNVVVDPKIWAATSSSNICVVQTPPVLAIATLTEVYEYVSPGQENLIVDIRVTNSGQADAIFDAASLTYNPTGFHSEIVVSPASGTLIPGGGYLDIRFHVDIDPAATTGARTITATVSGFDANNPTSVVSSPPGGTGGWEILDLAGMLSANDSPYIPEQYAFNHGQTIYGKFSGTLGNPNYYAIAVYDDPNALETEAAALIFSDYLDGSAGDVIIPFFKTSDTSSSNYSTWRIDIRHYTKAGNNKPYVFQGVLGKLYFENQEQSYLSGELLLSPDPVEVGATVTVTLCVANPVASGSTIAGVTPTTPVPTSNASGSLSELVGPVPASADIAPGFPATFTWHCSALTISGLVPASYSMIATFTGTDLNDSTTVTGTDISNSIIIAQRQIALASTTIGFGDMKVGELKWVGPTSVANAGNVELTDVAWRPSHLVHTNESDYINRSYITFSPASDFSIAVSSSQAASFSLYIPYNQPPGTHTAVMDAFDDFYNENGAREAEEPYATFTVQVNVLETAIVDVNEALIDIGNWPQGSITTAKTISALNLGNVNLSSLEFEMLDDGGLSATTTVTILPAGPQTLATDGALLASISAEVWEFETPGVYLMNWRLKDTVDIEASDTFQVRIGIGSMGLILNPLPIDMGNGTPTFTISNVPFTIENTGDLDLTKLKLVKGDLTFGGTGVIPGENIIPTLPATVASHTTVAATMSLYVAAGVPVGDYSGGQTIYEDLDGNDELNGDEPFFNFFMDVHVNEYRAIQVLSGTIDFGGRVPGETATISFQIKNIGSVELIDLVWADVDLYSAETPVETLGKVWYEFLPLPANTLAIGQVYDAVGSITIDGGTPQPDGNYGNNIATPALIFDDKVNPGLFDVVDDPYDSFNVLCQVGGKSLAILTDPIRITGAVPGSTSDSAFFEVQNTGRLLLKKTKAKAITDLTTGTETMSASLCIFSPTVFDAMSESQTKSAYWSVAVPPGTMPGSYTATLLVWNDDNSDGLLDTLEASDTATLEIEIISKKIIRVEPNPADIGFIPAGQTGSINISIYNDGNEDILEGICLHEVALDPVSVGPIPIASISMISEPATNSLPIGTMVNATILVTVPTGQTGYPYSSEQVMFIDEDGNGTWDPATEAGATFTLSLTVGQKLLSVQPLIDFGAITNVGPHNQFFWVRNDTTITLSYGTWQEISPLTKGADVVPSSCLEFIPTNFTVGAGATKNDCIASLTILPSQPAGVYVGTYTAFEDDNGNGIADGFEASGTFQVWVDVSDIPAVEIFSLSPLNLGNIPVGTPSPDFEISYRNIGNVALMLDWVKASMNLIPAGDAITTGEINFSIPGGLLVGEAGTGTVSITPAIGRTPGVYSGTQTLQDGTFVGLFPLHVDTLTLECNVVAGASGPSLASGSVWQEVATLTWTPADATWIMSAWVSLEPMASAAIRLLEVDGDGNHFWRGIEIDSSGGIVASGTTGSGVVMSNRTSSPAMTWHRVYFSFTSPNTLIASNTYMVLQNTTEYSLASQSVWFDGIQLERSEDGQTRPSPYTAGRILVSPNRAQTLEGKHRYYEW